MNNPINNSVFDTRDLIEYLDFLVSELVDKWNDLSGEDFKAYDINDILGTGGYEFVENTKELFAQWEEDNSDEIEEFKAISMFCEYLSSSPDYTYGESVIHEDYFTEYTEDLLKDCGYIPADLPEWIVLDFEATAENVKVDYSQYQYMGDTYYIRS